RFIPEKLAEPLSWLRPRMIFVNSMSDMFHDDVAWDVQAAIIGVCCLAGQHTFQILTKRADLMRERLSELTLDVCLEMAAFFGVGLPPHGQRRKVPELMRGMGRDPDATPWPPQNILIGPSIENQDAAKTRLPAAIAIAALGWRVMLSLEPLLGPVDMECVTTDPPNSGFAVTDGFGRFDGEGESQIDWVIVGGESGDGARPMHPDWARLIRDQCQAAGVPFFFKQWGEWLPFKSGEFSSVPSWLHDRTPVCLVKPEGRAIRPYSLNDRPGHEMARVGKKTAGRLLDGRTWDEFPAGEA